MPFSRVKLNVLVKCEHILYLAPLIKVTEIFMALVDFLEFSLLIIDSSALKRLMSRCVSQKTLLI